MKFTIENTGQQLVCPICGREHFEYVEIDYPVTKLECSACGAVVELKKPVRENKED